MKRITGRLRVTSAAGENVRAFVPLPLPPREPNLKINVELEGKLNQAMAKLGQLNVAAAMVPSTQWFLYGFVRKEAVITSQIEGTQATLEDVFSFEATHKTDKPADVEEVCNYVEALSFAREQIKSKTGLPISSRLLCETHAILMQGVRGSDKLPGEIRRSQNWVGGTRPGNASHVPPPPDEVLNCMNALDKWIHSEDGLPPLIRTGLAHVQFETIHPFLDGNGRMGRLLIALLVEHWGLLSSPMLYISLALKRRRADYYAQLSQIRKEGDWESWSSFYLDCVIEAANDGVESATQIYRLMMEDRARLLSASNAQLPAVRLLEFLPSHPLLTLSRAVEILETSKPTASKAIQVLIDVGILYETTGQQRDRVYAYRNYMKLLAMDTYNV